MTLADHWRSYSAIRGHTASTYTAAKFKLIQSNINPLLADPSCINANVVKFVIMKYNNYLMWKIFFLNFFGYRLCKYPTKNLLKTV